MDSGPHGSSSNVHEPTGQMIAVSLWRGQGSSGGLVRYDVPARDNQTILDIVTHIQRNIDNTLSYRFACRVGMCGSCAMTVNGVPRWTCRTHASRALKNGRLTVEPLRNMPVIKDLVADMTPFFDKWQKAEGRFKGNRGWAEDVEPVRPDSPQRQAADAGIECINCAICYAACDVVAWNPDYLGPAALNRAWTLMNDVRDTAGAERLKAVSAGDGCHNCHSHQSCMTFCPNELNPTASIAGLKRMAVRAALKGEL
jgi:fumarate reductase iron-sulfur subunit